MDNKSLVVSFIILIIIIILNIILFIKYTKMIKEDKKNIKNNKKNNEKNIETNFLNYKAGFLSGFNKCLEKEVINKIKEKEVKLDKVNELNRLVMESWMEYCEELKREYKKNM